MWDEAFTGKINNGFWRSWRRYGSYSFTKMSEAKHLYSCGIHFLSRIFAYMHGLSLVSKDKKLLEHGDTQQGIFFLVCLFVRLSFQNSSRTHQGHEITKAETFLNRFFYNVGKRMSFPFSRQNISTSFKQNFHVSVFTPANTSAEFTQ